MKTYQYILLDWDGNLAKTLDLWLDAYRAALQKCGIAVTDEAIAARFGDFPAYMKELGIKDVDAIYEAAHAAARKSLPDVELYPDALAVLTALHASGKKLALITTSPHRNIQNLLEKHNLKPFFGVIVAGDDVAHHKPHPEPLEKALQALGGTKDAAVMIGDSSIDVGAANNMGIDSILFYPPEHKKFYDFGTLQQLRPTHVIDDFRIVLDIV